MLETPQYPNSGKCPTRETERKLSKLHKMLANFGREKSCWTVRDWKDLSFCSICDHRLIVGLTYIHQTNIALFVFVVNNQIDMALGCFDLICFYFTVISD